MLFPQRAPQKQKAERRKGFAGNKGIREEEESQAESARFLLIGPIFCNLPTLQFYLTLSFHSGTKLLVYVVYCLTLNTSGTLRFVIPLSIISQIRLTAPPTSLRLTSTESEEEPHIFAVTLFDQTLITRLPSGIQTETPSPPLPVSMRIQLPCLISFGFSIFRLTQIGTFYQKSTLSVMELKVRLSSQAQQVHYASLRDLILEN